MTRLLAVLSAALVVLAITRLLRPRAHSRLQALARDYLRERLTAQGIADQVPARCIGQIAERYADAVQSRPLGRLAAASELMRRIDAAVVVVTAWVREGRALPRSVAQWPLPELGAADELAQLYAPPDPED
jgi:hypothetical protein